MENLLVENSTFTATHENMKLVLSFKVNHNGSQGAGLFHICIGL